jgi:hypothetical protein
MWLSILSYVFIFMCFFEPANAYDLNFDVSSYNFAIETIIITFFSLDFLFEVIHLLFDIDRTLK